MILRKLKRLEHVIGMTVVSPDMLENGWTFEGDPDPLTGFRYLYELYAAADPAYNGPATVPVLWDTRTRTIVNNEFERDHPHAQPRVRRLGRRGR